MMRETVIEKGPFGLRMARRRVSRPRAWLIDTRAMLVLALLDAAAVLLIARIWG